MNFLKWYKNKVESNELFPPESVWENIQDDLDIDNSWEQISRRLDSRARLISGLRAVAAAGILVLALAGVYRQFLTQEQPGNNTTLAEGRRDESTAGQKEGTQKEGTQVDVKDEQPADEQTAKVQGKDQPTDGQANGTKQQNEGERPGQAREEIKEEDSEKQTVRAGTVREYMAAADMKEAAGIPVINIPGRINTDIIYDQLGSTKQGLEKIKKAFKKFYIGSTGQLANTWLLNQKTISGFKSTSLVSTNPSFGSDFGVYAGTGLTEHIDLQMDLNILAQNKQEYNEYMDGNYVTSNMQFNYTRLGLSLRYFINSDNFMQGEHALNMGPYIAYLHNASQNIDTETIYITGDYNTLDYGLQAGYEYVFPLVENLGLGTGFRAYYGLNNIYAGTESIPDYLNATNNASVNITLSLKYLLSR
ncbi:MAG: hypothetical protein ACQEQW_07220 [Bacteroidota bacterium]